jgi:hypothetical protein
MALVLNGPVWWQQTLDPGRGSPAVKGVCSVLYVVGMQVRRALLICTPC